MMKKPLENHRNILVNLLNCVICGLNTKVDADKNNYQLPRFIVMIPEDDILCFINYFAYGISMISGRCLNWLINEVDQVIEARKDHLCRRRGGTVNLSEPKIIWLAMMNRPNTSYDNMLAVHGKYNRNLKELVAQRINHYYLDMTKQVVEYNGRGKDVFWMELDRILEEVDDHKVDLKENLVASDQQQTPYPKKAQSLQHFQCHDTKAQPNQMLRYAHKKMPSKVVYSKFRQ